MRGRPFGLLLAAAVTFPASAVAAPVLVMVRGGHVTRVEDRFLAPAAVTPTPSSTPPAPDGGASVARAGSHVNPRATRPRAGAARATRPRAGAGATPTHPKRSPERTVRSELARMYRTGQIDRAGYRRYSADFSAALATVKRLAGTRTVELEAVVQNLHEIAARGMLTATRLPALFLTLERNRQWWSTGPLLSSGQRVEFDGSQLVWEYYPGQGIELQALGTFGKADGLYTAGPSQYPSLRQLLSEMIPLAALRGGGLTWESYFHFDGGVPPWTSAMSQGTALEALTRASEAFPQSSGPPSGGTADQPPSNPYLVIAQRALPIFTLPPPLGVRVSADAGVRYLQYSFTPGTDIINAFLQSLIGLYDYAHVSGDQDAERLFEAGDAQARAELPRFDTGAWSLYQPGVEDTLGYHTLVTGFLDQLCTRTSAPVYCGTAQHFHDYLKTPPALRLLTASAAPHAPFAIRFSLSKYSHVGIVVQRDQQTVWLTSGYFSYGVNTFSVPSLRPGNYGVRLAATDLPGNFNRIAGTLQVSRRAR